VLKLKSTASGLVSDKEVLRAKNEWVRGINEVTVYSVFARYEA